MENKKVRVGLVGFGTVGTGVAKILLEDGENIRRRTGLDLELACVVDIDTATRRKVTLPDGLLTSDMGRILNDPSISIAAELIGGTTAARDIVSKTLHAGKDVVTANKALIAECGTELFDMAKRLDRCIAFEASCAGGVPIISVLRTGLAANRIDAIYGILNGTCNYILTNMTKNNVSFRDALGQAQEKGYAEADPTLDINGTDSAHKLAILARLAFGCDIKLSDIYIEGIDNIGIDDIRNGLEMGYVLKLLAIGCRAPSNSVSLRVHPSFVSRNNPIAHVDGPFNAVSIFAHAAGNTMYYGRGAGMMPTAGAVVADMIEVATGNSARLFRMFSTESPERTGIAISDIGSIDSRFYIKLMAEDKPGVVARYSRILGDYNISISGVIQHEGCGPDNTVPVIITTHPTRQKNMTDAIHRISRLDVISGRPVCIRIVDIPEDRD